MAEKPISFTDADAIDNATDIPTIPTSPSNTNKNDLRQNANYSYNKDENSYSSDQNTPRKTNSSASVNFETTDIYKFIQDHGMRVIWERSYLCTCRNPETGKPDLNCPICGGTGRAYLPGIHTRMLIQSQSRGEQYNKFGTYQKGSALGTTQLETPVATRDRITCPDVHIIQAFIFNNTPHIMDKGIKLPYDVYKFLYVGVKTGELKESTDYTYDTTSKMFKVVNKDLIGMNITLRFDAVLRYIITNITKENRYQYSNNKVIDKHTRYEALPKLCLLTREQSIIGETTKSLANSSSLLSSLNTELNESSNTKTGNVGSVDTPTKEGFRI